MEPEALHIDLFYTLAAPASEFEALFVTHPGLAWLLNQAVPYLQYYFGTGSVCRLEIDDDHTVYAAILWPGSVEAVRSALRRFDEEWWLWQARPMGSDLVFTYELI